MEEITTDERTWREKLLDDKNFNQNTPYNLNKLIGHFEAVTLDMEHINAYEFLSAIYEFTKAFFSLSSALSMGFADITDKVAIWRELYKTNFKEECYTDMQTIMEQEIISNMQNLNGGNNSKLGHKKGSPFFFYQSGCRTLVRLSWFLQFIYHIFKNMLESNEPFYNMIKKAYNDTLSSKHPWIVRTAVKYALNFMGSKKGPATKAFFGKEELDDETRETMKYLIELIFKTFTGLNDWLGKKNLLELP